MKQSHKLAVMVSGSGTLLEHMIDEKLPISLVVAEKYCRGLVNANNAGLDTLLLARTGYGWDNTRRWNDQPDFKRAKFSLAVAEILNARGITITAMAGFMTILAPEFFTAYNGVLLNIHPSLLPKYKGERAVADALEAGEKVTGTTVHIAIEELDSGPIIEQATVPIEPDDTVDSLHERIKQTERPLYAQVLGELLAGTRSLPPQK
jgi:formyltetrahydrofolate-dependent phosphoribosylglycinamide formyltransferase